ncbi:MAG: M48 family metalloprotease [Candidatus Accumulibacter sp.]|jgi:predicted Zn-dependent protease|nr:M48 family metalloprotease [Accumulibacter sp.]
MKAFPFFSLTRVTRILAAAGAFAAILLPVMPARADGLPDLGEAARAELSAQMERKIGESIMNDIRLHEPGYIDDPEVSDYLNYLGHRLVAASSDSTGNFHFFAIQDGSINAFAMFGGFIGVNSGTILTAQSESELAGVLAHEVAHVTQNHLVRQISNQKQMTLPSILAMLAGVLAARSNSSAAAAGIMGAQAAVVQSQLAFTREYEREADRVGYQMLQRAGFDVRGMTDFFERLQRAGRLYESNAPVYLRSHPLTIERLSDMQNRAQSSAYRQIVNSMDFEFVRAKLRAMQDLPHEAVAGFARRLEEKKYTSLAATRYGLAVAHMRARNAAAAQKEIEAVQKLRAASAMVSSLAAEIRAALGDSSGAQNIYSEALRRYPRAKGLVYGCARLLHSLRQYDQALRFVSAQLQANSSDSNLHEIQAKIYAAQGKRLLQHRALAEFYALRGLLNLAVEQLLFAQQATDGNFYEQSVVDARLRELRALRVEDEKLRKSGGF